MFLDRSRRTGDLTVAFSREDFRRLVDRAEASGTTPEALIERLTRDAYGHHVVLADASESEGSASEG